MIKNYFKTAWRHLANHKVYSLINVLGLALGIASCLVIFLVVQYELGYDQFYRKYNRIYRVTLNAIDFNPSVSLGIVPALRIDFPDLEAVSQVWYRESALITVGAVKFEEKKVLLADKYFPEIFEQHWLEGNPNTALGNPNSIVLTEHIAHKYFGSKEALGQFINFENRYLLKVTGIIGDVPGNTHLPFNMIVSFATIANDVKGMMSNFYAIAGGAFAYILLPEKLSVAQLQQKMHGFIEKNWGKEIANEARLPIQPLTDIHFDSRYLNNTISYTTSRETYYALGAVAVLIIIIACINFINLATAQAINRSKEVGVRKVLGSTRSQLVRQFLGETTLLVVIALILGILITAAFLPTLSVWLSLRINIGHFLQPSMIAVALVGILFVILLAGLYPAFVQSAFRPSESLKGKSSFNLKGIILRKGLVVVQFSICQIMIIGTLVVAYQMDFFENRDLGFEKEAVISFNIPDKAKREMLRQDLQNNPGVKEFCFSSGAPGISNNFTSFNSPEAGITKDDVTELEFIDDRYMKMFAFQTLAGQPVQRTNAGENDTVYNVVVNETMIHKLGITSPQRAIGAHIILNGSWMATIMGVVKDFQSESKHKKIRPCVLLYRQDAFYMASVKLQPRGIHQTVSRIGDAWSRLFPENVFTYEFLDDHIAAWYSQEQKEYTAFKLFACIAILIGCLGLYGLVAFAATQRTKEVGIRKVLGASLADIVFLFSKEFALLIALAFLIAAPVAYYVMNNWLQSFAYQVRIGAGIFIIAVLSSFLIAACTIAHQALKAAVVNPVKSLRTEG